MSLLNTSILDRECGADVDTADVDAWLRYQEEEGSTDEDDEESEHSDSGSDSDSGSNPKKRNRTIADPTTDTKKTSEVWNHFTPIKNSNPPRSKCNHCPKTYASHSTKNGTSTMSRHMKYKCKNSPVRIKKEGKNQSTLTFKPNNDGVQDLVHVSFSQESVRSALAVMVILDELSFRFVEGEGFLHFCRVAVPKFKVPCRTTVARDCIALYLKEKKKLRNVLRNQKVCITTDTWTSIQNINYMVVTAHYVDKDWKLTKKILNFFVIPNHKGETIGRMIEKCLLEWKIDRLLTVTCDNAYTNNVAIESLKTRTKHWPHVMLEHEFVHIRCSAHILNLIVRSGLDEFDESINRVRDVVRYVRSSPSRWARWKKFVAEQKIESKKRVCLDIATRWNSTYMMLETALKFERAFTRMGLDDDEFKQYFLEDNVRIEEDEDDEPELVPPTNTKKPPKEKRKKACPNSADWERVKLFVNFLELYYKTTNKISGSKYVTCELLFNELVMVHCNLKKICGSLDDGLCRIGLKMYKKFEKYWRLDKINPLLLVAVVLDPRFKLGYFPFSLKKIYGADTTKVKLIQTKVETTLKRMCEWYNGKNASSSLNVSEPLMVDEMEVDIASEWKRHNKSGNLGSMSEVDKYLTSPIEEELEGSKFEILDWWKVNAAKYPVLSLVARDVLAIPVTSVASESAFSTGGRILDSFRSSLRPNTVEALICTQNWIRSTTKPIDVHDDLKELEDYDEVDAEIFEKAMVEAGLN